MLDTNGDGKITKPWNEPAAGGRGAAAKPAPFDPALDTRVPIGTYAYGIVANPVDDSIWGATDDYPGELFRFDPGSNPPQTCISERYTIPKELGYRTRGVDVDRNGVVWLALASSSQLASFDRKKCKTLNGPATRDGLHCKEGWAFYPVPGPTFKGTTIGTDFHYYNWVDQFNTLGLGENVPIVNGSNSDSLIAFLPEKKQWVMMRVPFPMAFHSRGVDGRIDDPKAGWKGRGLYATYGADAAWHIEGGPGRARKPGEIPDPARSAGEIGNDTYEHARNHENTKLLISSFFVVSCFRAVVWLRQVNDPAPQRDGDRRAAVLHLQLGQDVLDVHLRRLLADAERGADFLVAHPLGDQLEDFDLARGQRRPGVALREPRLDVGADRMTPGMDLPHDPDEIVRQRVLQEIGRRRPLRARGRCPRRPDTS